MASTILGALRRPDRSSRSAVWSRASDQQQGRSDQDGKDSVGSSGGAACPERSGGRGTSYKPDVTPAAVQVGGQQGRSTLRKLFRRTSETHRTRMDSTASRTGEEGRVRLPQAAGLVVAAGPSSSSSPFIRPDGQDESGPSLIGGHSASPRKALARMFSFSFSRDQQLALGERDVQTQTRLRASRSGQHREEDNGRDQETSQRLRNWVFPPASTPWALRQSSQAILDQEALPVSGLAQPRQAVAAGAAAAAEVKVGMVYRRGSDIRQQRQGRQEHQQYHHSHHQGQSQTDASADEQQQPKQGHPQQQGQPVRQLQLQSPSGSQSQSRSHSQSQMQTHQAHQMHQTQASQASQQASCSHSPSQRRDRIFAAQNVSGLSAAAAPAAFAATASLRFDGRHRRSASADAFCPIRPPSGTRVNPNAGTFYDPVPYHHPIVSPSPSSRPLPGLSSPSGLPATGPPGRDHQDPFHSQHPHHSHRHPPREEHQSAWNLPHRFQLDPATGITSSSLPTSPIFTPSDPPFGFGAGNPLWLHRLEHNDRTVSHQPPGVDQRPYYGLPERLGPARFRSSIQLHRLHQSSENFEQSPSRRRPSVIPADLNDPHPFGVWLSDRQAPTSLPPPPRSLPGSLSRRKGEQTRNQLKVAADEEEPQVSSSHSEQDSSPLKSSTFGSHSPVPAAQPINPADESSCQSIEAAPDSASALPTQPSTSNRHGQRSSTAASHARNGSTASSTVFRSHHGGIPTRYYRISAASTYASDSILAPSPSVNTSTSVGPWSTSGTALTFSTSITTPLSHRKTNSSHRDSGAFSSRHHSIASVADFDPPLAKIDSWSLHREEPSNNSGTGSSSTTKPSTQSKSKERKQSTLRNKASRLGSRLLSRSRHFQSPSSISYSSTTETEASARFRTQGFDLSDTFRSSRNVRSSVRARDEQSPARLNPRRSLGALFSPERPNLWRRLRGRSSRTEDSESGQSDLAGRYPISNNSLPAHSQRRVGRFPDPQLAKVLSNRRETHDGGLRVGDVTAYGFPLTLPETPASEMAPTPVSEALPEEPAGSRPSSSGPSGTYRGSQGQVATITKRSGQRLGSVLQERFSPGPMPNLGLSLEDRMEDSHSQDQSSLSRETKSDGHNFPMREANEKIDAETVPCAFPASADFESQAEHDATRDNDLNRIQSVSEVTSPHQRQRTDSRPSTSPGDIMRAAAANNITGIPKLGEATSDQDVNGQSQADGLKRGTSRASILDHTHAPNASLSLNPDSGRLEAPEPDRYREDASASNGLKGANFKSPSRPLDDSRPTVRRALGKRAESESASMRTSRGFMHASKHSKGRSKDDTDGLASISAAQRDDILQGKGTVAPRSSTIASSIRRLMRRTSLKGKSQSISSLPPWTSPSRTPRTLPLDLEVEDRNAPSGFGQFGERRSSTSTKHERRTSLSSSKAKAKDASPGKSGLKTTSLFLPFRAKDPASSVRGKAKTDAARSQHAKFPDSADADESFGHSGPLESSYAVESSSQTSLGREELGADLTTKRSLVHQPSVIEEVSSDFADSSRTPRNGSPSHGLVHDENVSYSERDLSQSSHSGFRGNSRDADSGTYRDGDDRDRPISGLTATDDGMGVALGGQSSTDLTDSLAMNGLAAGGRQLSEPSGAEAARSGRSMPSHPKASTQVPEPLSKPQYGIPRIWQGVETTEHTTPPLAQLEIDSERRAPSSVSETWHPSRFDTATTTSSFKTAESSLGSPARSWTQTLRRSPRSMTGPLDLSLAQRMDPASGQHSPLSDLITNLERRMSSRATNLTAPYFDAQSISSDNPSELGFGPALAAGPSPSPDRPLSVSPATEVPEKASREALDEHAVDANSESVSNSASPDQKRRYTFGGAESSSTPSSASRRQAWSHGSQPSVGDVDESMQALSVTEIESHLAAVEAALRENRREGSFDPVYLRQRIHGNTNRRSQNASIGIMAEDGTFLHQTDETEPDVSMPGGWSMDANATLNTDDGRISLAPESQQAIADAVKQVRRAISSSQLQANDPHQPQPESPRSNEGGSDDEARDHLGELGDMTMRSEVTPVRAARRRQDTMRDIEESYGRMLALVQSSAVGATPSPLLKSELQRFGDGPPQRKSKPDHLSQSMQESQQESPLARPMAQAIERRERTRSTPVGASAPSSTTNRSLTSQFMGERVRGHGRVNSSGVEVPVSNSLSGLMGMPKDAGLWHLRGRTSSSSMSSNRRAASESPVRTPQHNDPVVTFSERERKRHSAGAKAPHEHRQAQIQAQTHEMPAQFSLREAEQPTQKRGSADQANVNGRASSGAGGTSPSATVKTLGTPRSQAADTSLSGPGSNTQWEDAHPVSQPYRVAFPRTDTNESTILQGTDAHQDRYRLSSSSRRERDSMRLSDANNDSRSLASNPRSPVLDFKSLATKVDGHPRTAEDHLRKRSRQQQLSASTTSSLRQIGTLSPAPSITSAVRNGVEVGSIRDWSSQVSYRPYSRSSAQHGHIDASGRLFRENVAGSMSGTPEVDALAAMGIIPPSSSSQPSIAAMLRRHELERESLLDSLERTRAEVVELRSRNESLTADLHAEVTRVLELERELERRDDREVQLIARSQHLENELAALQAEKESLGASLEEMKATAKARASPISTSRSPRAAQSPVIHVEAPASSQETGARLRPVSSSRPAHRSTRSEVLLPSPSMDQNEDLDGEQLGGSSSNRKRPVSLINGPSGLVREANEAKLGQSSTALAAASAERLATSDLNADDGSSPNLRSYPSLLGLNLNQDDMDWALVNEEPPEEASRDSLDEIRGNLSSFFASYTDAARGETTPASTLSPRKVPFETPSKSHRSGESGGGVASPPPRTSSIRQQQASNSPATGKRVPGSLGLPSASSLPRLVSNSQQASRRTGSTSSSVRSTSSRLQQPGTISGIPFGQSNRNSSSATTRSNYTHASTFTARSESPVGSFVTTWRSNERFTPPEHGGSVDTGSLRTSKGSERGSSRARLGGYYDPRRPGDYDPHALPATHEAMLDTSLDSTED